MRRIRRSQSYSDCSHRIRILLRCVFLNDRYRCADHTRTTFQGVQRLSNRFLPRAEWSTMAVNTIPLSIYEELNPAIQPGSGRPAIRDRLPHPRLIEVQTSQSQSPRGPRRQAAAHSQPVRSGNRPGRGIRFLLNGLPLFPTCYSQLYTQYVVVEQPNLSYILWLSIFGL